MIFSISNTRYFLVTLVFSISQFHSHAISNTTSPFNWAGHIVRGDIGSVANIYAWSSVSGALANFEPFIELGYEYAFVVDANIFLSAGLSWTITYPRNFQASKGFFEPPIALWYTPMSYLQVGYIFSNNILITGGLVYFWALLGSVRFELNDKWFFEFKSILWLDRIFDTNGFFGRGFDNISSSMGFGYHF